jgi:hypothetical protein
MSIGRASHIDANAIAAAVKRGRAIEMSIGPGFEHRQATNGEKLFEICELRQIACALRRMI